VLRAPKSADGIVHPPRYWVQVRAAASGRVLPGCWRVASLAAPTKLSAGAQRGNPMCPDYHEHITRCNYCNKEKGAYNKTGGS
jgi:hypothetical protein